MKKITISQKSCTLLLDHFSSTILWRGQEHKITRLLNLSYVLGTNTSSGELEKIPVSEISPFIKVDKSLAESPKISLSDLTDKEWSLAKERLSIIQPLLDLEHNCQEEDVQIVSNKENVSQATLYRWLKKFKNTGKLSSLINKRRMDKGDSRLSKEQTSTIAKRTA